MKSTVIYQYRTFCLQQIYPQFTKHVELQYFMSNTVTRNVFIITIENETQA